MPLAVHRLRWRPFLVVALALGLLAGLAQRHLRRAAAPAQGPSAERSTVPDTRQPTSNHTSPAPTPTDVAPDLAGFAQRLRALQTVQTEDTATAARLLQELLAYVTDANVEDIVKSLSGPELDTTFGLEALRRWMRVDPIVAADWLGARSDRHDAHVWIVATELARDNDALDGFIQLTADASWKQGVLHHAGRELADRDPVKAITLATLLPPGNERTDLLETTIYSWAYADSVAARNWLSAQPPSDQRTRLEGIAAKALSIKYPTHAPTAPGI